MPMDAEALAAELASIADRLVPHSSAHVRVSNERDAARRRVGQLEEELRAANQLLADAGSERDHATESQLYGQQVVIERTQSQFAAEKAAMQASISDLKAELSAARDAIVRREADIGSRVREVQELRAQLRAADAENVELQYLLRSWMEGFQALETRASQVTFVAGIHSQLIGLKRCHDKSKEMIR